MSAYFVYIQSHTCLMHCMHDNFPCCCWRMTRNNKFRVATIVVIDSYKFPHLQQISKSYSLDVCVRVYFHSLLSFVGGCAPSRCCWSLSRFWRVIVLVRFIRMHVYFFCIVVNTLSRLLALAAFNE